MGRLKFKCIFLVTLFLVLSACALFTPKTTIPVETREAVLENSEGDTLIIFLPGIGDDEQDFFKNGFVDSLKRQNKSLDVVAVNMHLGYYMERSFEERLKTDVIEPAKTRGYKHIWLVGTSLGGFGSLLYTAAQPDDIDGVIVLAPYLGKNALINDIKNYPSLAHWANANRDTNDDIAQDLWLPLADTHCLEDKTIYLAVGLNDKFEKANELLASRCSNIEMLQVEGGHNWKTWKLLWDDLLQRSGVL